MSWVAAAIAGGAVLGAYASNSAANKAAAGQQAGINAQQGMFNTVQGNVQPYINAGSTALNSLGTMTQPGGQLVQPFTNADLTTNLAPNYQFQLDQGLGALDNQMNATGGIYSGNTLKAINDYAQNYAGNAYQNAFNNWNTTQGNIYNRLAGIANIGTQANQTLAGAASGAANGIQQGAAGMGNASAAGTMSVANSLAGGLSGLGSYSYLNSLTSPAAASNAPSSYYIPYGPTSSSGYTGLSSPSNFLGS